MILDPSLKFWLNFVHPATMWVLLGLSLYALYLGIQVRRTRTITDAEERKELIKAKVSLRHFQIGSLLLVLMVLGALGGMAVTYINNGKLFLGPHLLAGLAMTALVALSASLSPYMQKGYGWARSLHIFLNVSLVGLFGWQALSGLEIIQRIISNA